MKKYDVDGDNVISIQECTMSPFQGFCPPAKAPMRSAFSPPVASPIGPGANNAMKSAMVDKVTTVASHLKATALS